MIFSLNFFTIDGLNFYALLGFKKNLNYNKFIDLTPAIRSRHSVIKLLKLESNQEKSLVIL